MGESSSFEVMSKNSNIPCTAKLWWCLIILGRWLWKIVSGCHSGYYIFKGMQVCHDPECCSCLSAECAVEVQWFLQLQLCRLWSRTENISRSKRCSPKSATGTEIRDCWTVLIKLLKIVSNLWVKSVFIWQRSGSWWIQPSLLNDISVLLWQVDKNEIDTY